MSQRQQLDAGADWINDVWGLRADPNMAVLAARANAPVILMHNRSKPSEAELQSRLGGMYIGSVYNDLIADISEELLDSVKIATKAGIQKDHIILDPGIGFGKTIDQNLELINRLDEICSLGYPVLIGPSRKSFIGYTLDLPPSDRIGRNCRCGSCWHCERCVHHPRPRCYANCASCQNDRCNYPIDKAFGKIREKLAKPMKKLQTFLQIKIRNQRRNQSSDARRAFAGRLGFTVLLVITLLFSATVFSDHLAVFNNHEMTYPQLETWKRSLDTEKGVFAHPTRLMDRSGSEIIAELSIPGITRQYRSITLTETEHVSEDLINAVIASTEPDYWTSPGFSLRAFNPNEHPTIAQRLVFNLLLSNEKPDTKRAIREKLLASQAISVYGRQKVLEWYLNSVEFGNFAYRR